MTGPLVQRAEAAWDGAAPDWVVALAGACDESGQAKIAQRLGYSAAVVSTVLKGAYAGNLARVEAAVRGQLMNATVDCPLLGELNRAACVGHQRRRRDRLAANPTWVRLWRACRGGCPHSLVKGEPDVER